ncbi:MAG TPA: MlaD family protein [Gammaproteobacteria bacterium]|nr:MlaD family protein [Gammaproteobacteria bacterium]
MTTKRHPNAAAIGAFVLGGIALLAVGILAFGGTRWFSRADRAVIYFERPVSGLQVGSPVTFQGVTVGSVQRMAVSVTSENFQTFISVFVELRPADLIVDKMQKDGLEGTVAQLVARGLRATLEMQSLITGQLRVDLSFAPNAQTVSPRTRASNLPEIPVIESDLEKLRDGLSDLPIGDIVASTQRVLVRLEKLSDDVEPLLATADTELTRVGESVRSAADAGGHFATTTEASVQRLETELTATLAEARDLIAAGKGELGGVGAAVASLNDAAQHIDQLARNLNGMLDPDAASRRELDEALRDLAATAGSLKEFAREVERSPNALLLGTRQ